MDAKKCDRCGKFYENKYEVEVSDGGYTVCNAYSELDLCEDCRSDLDVFMSEKQEASK